MGSKRNKYVLGGYAKPAFRFDHAASSAEQGSSILQDLLETPPQDFQGKDIAALNLICAPALLGSEALDISGCIGRLDRLAAQAKGSIDRNIYKQPNDPDYGHCEPMWRMSMLITVIKRTYGVVYDPEVIAEGKNTLMDSSRRVFLNGVLDENRHRRHGTCASIPVLVVAVARRLGYPVGLVTAGRHVFARWEGDGVCFNIEASNPLGMTIQSDDEYKRDFVKDRDKNNTYYLRTLTAAEEFALFLTFRVECLHYAARYEETLLWSARALQFAPGDSGFLRLASTSADLALKHRLWRKYPEIKIPPMDTPEPFFFNIANLLRLEERSLHLTIRAHQKEADEEIDAARELYEDSCRQNFHGNNEQRDLQRFLKQHNVPGRVDPLMPPKNLGQPRHFKLFYNPRDEARTLMQLAHEFEVNGEYLKARNALKDLYMFDPSNSGVFLRARFLERHPQFQVQLKASVLNKEKKRNQFIALNNFASTAN
jgi:hypothetical protein